MADSSLDLYQRLSVSQSHFIFPRTLQIFFLRRPHSFVRKDNLKSTHCFAVYYETHFHNNCSYAPPLHVADSLYSIKGKIQKLILAKDY